MQKWVVIQVAKKIENREKDFFTIFEARNIDSQLSDVSGEELLRNTRVPQAQPGEAGLASGEAAFGPWRDTATYICLDNHT